MKAPFPYFGGKRRVADVVWAGLGDVDSYTEPFAGSLAVLLERPGHHQGSTETVNDADSFICNFWRALQADPDQVAYWADWPVNETDLIARHLWLVNTGRTRLVEHLESDPEWYDVQVAGWWVWGICSWIGSGWCTGTGPWMHGPDGTTVEKRPISNSARGVNRQLPHLGAGRGVNRPDGPDAWRSGGSGAPANPWERDPDTPATLAYLRVLADRLRRVRVCTGDWSRVVTRGALDHGETVGIFLDPPYLGEVRAKDLYATDDHTIAHDVRDWALTNGDNPRYRICLAGYLPEHDHLIPDTWRRHQWTGSVSYSTAASAERQDGNHANRDLECLWFSPHCHNPADMTQTLWEHI